MTTRDVVVLMPEFVARPGLGPEFRERLELLARLSREEAGCLEYTLLEDPTDPCRLRLYERWADAGALASRPRRDVVRAGVRGFLRPFPGRTAPGPASASSRRSRRCTGHRGVLASHVAGFGPGSVDGAGTSVDDHGSEVASDLRVDPNRARGARVEVRRRRNAEPRGVASQILRRGRPEVGDDIQR